MTLLIPDDHLDLVVTAALEWKVLSGPPAATLAAPGTLTSLDGTSAGVLIREQNHQSVRIEQVATYTFREVTEPLIPVEVLKACHAISYACRNAPAWGTSVAHTLVTQTSWAAAVRMPGYSEAPWAWHRRRTSVVLAVAQNWRPDLPDVDWVDPEGVTAARWRAAGHVVVTDEALVDLIPRVDDGELEPRPNVFAVTAAELPTLAAWAGVADHVVHWPECLPWLTTRLNLRAPSS